MILRAASLAVLFGSLGMLLCGCDISYLFSQGYHQLKLLSSRRSLDEVLADPSVSVSLKERIRLVQSICEFAEKDLMLKPRKSYQSFIEIQQPVVAYVVSACPKDRLEPHLWRFPLVGSFPYKGFFHLEEAKKEKARLESEGLDTHLAGATAFSALGWFADPIYSSMLNLDDIELCYTIFHELVHATVFFPDQVEFNEQLATLVGWQATVQFFREKKKDFHKVEEVLRLIKEEEALAQFLVQVKDELVGLYGSSMSLEEKLKKRQEIFEMAKAQLGLLGDTVRKARIEALAAMEWNNATFLALWRYRYDVGNLKSLLAKLKGDLRGLVQMVLSWQQQDLDPLLKLREETTPHHSPQADDVGYLGNAKAQTAQ